MSHIYSVEVQVAATAYIRADSEEEALKIANELKNEMIEVNGGGGISVIDTLAISDLPLDHPDLPDVSLSPAMTVIGPFVPNEIEHAA